MSRKDKTHIMIHCSATHADWMAGKTLQAKRAEIKKWHVQERGWKDIGYAYIIDRDGKVVGGRDLDADGDFIEETAAAATGWNTKAVHVCLLGGYGSSANDRFEDHFTPEQDVALRGMIDHIRKELGRNVPLIGHNEVARKACPGFQVKEWFYGKKERTTAMQSTTVQAAVTGAGATAVAGAQAVSELSGEAQVVAIIGMVVVLLCFAWIFRERIKKFAAGIK